MAVIEHGISVVGEYAVVCNRQLVAGSEMRICWGQWAG